MFYLKFLSAFLFIVLLGVTFGFTQVEPRLPLNFSLQVNGQVRYASSKRPAENILVRIESFSGGLVAQKLTDRNGKFSFERLRPLQYIVTIRTSGYFEIREDVNLVTANTSYLNLQLVEDKNSVATDKSSRAKQNPTNLSVIDANIPVEAQDEFAKGQILLNKNSKEKVPEIIEHFEKAISIYPKYLEANILLGLVYMDLQKWEKAENPLLAAITINSQASTAYFALGETYRRTGKYADAVTILSEGLKLNNNSTEGHNTLAKVYLEKAPFAKDEQAFKKDLQNAWEEINKSLTIDPNIAETHLLAGNLLLKARRAKDALQHFEEYLKLEPNGEFAAPTKVLIKKIKKAI